MLPLIHDRSSQVTFYLAQNTHSVTNTCHVQFTTHSSLCREVPHYHPFNGLDELFFSAHHV